MTTLHLQTAETSSGTQPPKTSRKRIKPVKATVPIPNKPSMEDSMSDMMKLVAKYIEKQLA